MIELKKIAYELFNGIGIYLKAESQEESEEIQELLFQIGYLWADFKDGQKVRFTSYRYISARCDRYPIKHLVGTNMEVDIERLIEITPKELHNILNPSIVENNNQADGTRIGSNQRLYLLTSENLYWFNDEEARWEISENSMNYFVRRSEIIKQPKSKSFKPTTIFNEEIW